MVDEPVASDGPVEPDRGPGPPIVAGELDGLDDWVFLSRGGHGDVWAATERSLGRRVAVKILPQLTTADARHRFRVETSAIGSLTGHQSILSVLRSGITADGHGVIVMEYAERSLADQLSTDGPLPPDQVASIITKVAAGLDAAHASGVLHLDVKPANILMSSFGEPKLADFGVAALSSPPMDATIDDPGQWVAGMTPGYGPPELLEGAEPSVSTDVHLLAATAVALLSGPPPYARDGDSPVDVWRRTLTTEPDLAELRVPEQMIPALAAGLARDPSQRPASAGQFAQLLSGDLPASTADASSDDPPTDPPDNRASRRRLAMLGVAAAALLVFGVVLLATRGGGGESDVAADGPATTAASELWVDAGLWGGVGLIDVAEQELVTLLPGQEIERPLAGNNGVWALETEVPDQSPLLVRALDPDSGATLDQFELVEQGPRSTCALFAGDAVWASCTSDAFRIPDDPVDQVLEPEVTLYRLTDDGAEPVLTRDGRLAFSSAHGSDAWLVIEEDDALSEVGAMVVRVDGDEDTSVRLPPVSQRPEAVRASPDGLWIVDGREAQVVEPRGGELELSEPVLWNLDPDEASLLGLSVPVLHDGGIAFLWPREDEQLLRAVHLRPDAEPIIADIPFPYITPGLEPVLAITAGGKWWTLGDVERAPGGISLRGGFTLVELEFPAAATGEELRFSGRAGPLADPALQAVGDDLVVVAELPESDISAVIVDGTNGRTRATIPLQQRSLLPLIGPENQVVVADLWTASTWIVDGLDATQGDGPNIPDPPVALGDEFASVSRQRGGGGFYSWDGEWRRDIVVSGELFTDGTALWFENDEGAGVIDISTGRPTPLLEGSGGVSIYSGTRGLVRNVAVIGGEFWRITEGSVTRTRADGTQSSIAIPASLEGWAIAPSPTGSVAVVVGGEVHLIDPTTERITATAPIETSSPGSYLPTGYLVSDDTSLWWVALYGGFAIQLDPATGQTMQRVDDLGDGIATAAVSKGALIAAHENSGTLTRVDGDGERVTREVGARPYWVSASDRLVVVGLQGERAVAEFDSDGLTERWRTRLGPPGPDS